MKSSRSIVALLSISSLALMSAFMNCSAYELSENVSLVQDQQESDLGNDQNPITPQDPELPQEPPTQNTNPQCSAADIIALERQMTASLQAFATDHSFYLELRRPGVDSRVFKFSRDLDGPVDENSTVQAASTAKMIAATIILDVVANPTHYPGGGLVNGKRLTLNSLARDFLPDGKGGTLWRSTTGAIPDSNRLSGVTLRHLLSFTSGLELEKAPAGAECIGKAATTSTYSNCIMNLVSVNLNRNTSTNEPRTFYYNGAHLHVAMKMAINAAGVPNLAELFKIFKATHGVFDGNVSPAAPVQVAGPGAYFPFSDGNSSPNPAGTFRYRAGDYGLFLKKLSLGEIIPPNYLDEMMSNQIQKLGASIEYTPAINGEDWKYGLGLWNECHALLFSEACLEKRFSSPGSFGSYPFIDFNLFAGQSYPLIGFLARGGNDSGTAEKGIAIYRSLGGGRVGQKDLAQKWAANLCQ